jgi:hypothetical protein
VSRFFLHGYLDGHVSLQDFAHEDKTHSKEAREGPFRTFKGESVFLLDGIIDFHLVLHDRLYIVFAPFIHSIENRH